MQVLHTDFRSPINRSTRKISIHFLNAERNPRDLQPPARASSDEGGRPATGYGGKLRHRSGPTGVVENVLARQPCQDACLVRGHGSAGDLWPVE